MILCFTCLLFGVLMFITASGFETGYLTTSCNGEKAITDSYRLESSTGLVYNNNMDCTFTTTAPVGEKILVLFRQFELEDKNNGQCVDHVTFHDGNSKSSPIVNNQTLCSNTPPNNVTSSSNVLTLRLVTDSTAVLRGFELLFVTFTDAPCSSGSFACSNNICVQSISECDGFDQCGDKSDEANCAAAAVEDNQSYTELIIGLSVLFVIICLVGSFVGVYFYRKHKFKKLLRQFRAMPDVPIKEH